MIRSGRAGLLLAVLAWQGCTLDAGGRAASNGAPAVRGDDAGRDGAEGPTEATDAGDDAATPRSDGSAPEEPPTDAGVGPLEADDLRLDQLQLKGSFKSYHVAPAIPLLGRNFSQQTLTQQLANQGVRALHLDVHVQGGDFAVYDTDVIDRGSRCESLAACLDEIAEWSAAHPRHVPVAVWLELKDAIDDVERLEGLVTARFGEGLLRPADVQGGRDTLHAALLAEGWPRLGQVRGRVMFVLAGNDGARRAYTHDFADLTGRAMFVAADGPQASAPWAAIVRNDDPLDVAGVRASLTGGLLVASLLCRPNDDDDTCAARRDGAFTNGPHLLFDTFPAQVDSRSYWLDMREFGEARCHPTRAPAGCPDAMRED